MTSNHGAPCIKYQTLVHIGPFQKENCIPLTKVSRGENTLITGRLSLVSISLTVGDASPRQAREHIGDGCVKWKHFLNDVADQTGTVRGRMERVEMSLKPGFSD